MAWAIGATTAFFHLSTASLYGYHRDELYYLACGRRLAWGYADHPPLTPLLYRASDEVFGHSLLGLRVLPALLHGALVVVTALLAREFGAQRRGEIAAALAAAVAPMFLTTGHFLTTVTAEAVAWTVAVLVLTRILRGGSPRLWIAFGLAVGVGLADKWTTLFLVAGLAAGLALSDQRRLLWNPWVPVGAALAAAIVAPTVVWQARHGWPQLELSSGIRDPLLALATPPFLLVFLGAGTVLAIPGLWWLLRDAERFRPLGIAFVAIVGLVIATGAKPYYAGVFGAVLLAAGAARAVSRAAFVAMAILGVAAAPFAMPLLPQRTARLTTFANQEIGEMVGWSELVDLVARVHHRHPGAAIFTANYSEAASIEVLGRSRGLPQPFSGHNTYWFWGHPSGRSPETIVVGSAKFFLERYFTDVERVATFRSPDRVPNMEDGTAIWLARGQRQSWEALWPQLKHIQ